MSTDHGKTMSKICPHCGCDLDAPKKGKPRSVPQHKRYFALIRAAFYHWPDGHEFRPQSEEHLRKWLQCKAGYHKVDSIDTAGMKPEHAVAVISSRCAQAGPHAFFKSAGSRFYIFRSNSVDFDTLPHLQACAVFDDIAEIIEAETGVKCDEMIKTAPRAQKKERAPEVVA